MANIDVGAQSCDLQIVIALDPNGRVLMTRDMQLIRLILLEIKSRTDTTPRPIQLDEPDDARLFRHVEMLHESKLIEIVGNIHGGRYDLASNVMIKDMTWEGHEFISNMESKGVWNEVKSKFSASEIAGMSWELLKLVTIQTAKHVAKTRLGFDIP